MYDYVCLKLSVNLYIDPKLIGIILQRYTHRNQRPAKNFMRWINKIKVQTSGVTQGPIDPKHVVVRVIKCISTFHYAYLNLPDCKCPT